MNNTDNIQPFAYDYCMLFALRSIQLLPLGNPIPIEKHSILRSNHRKQLTIMFMYTIGGIHWYIS